jgi:hypothetical protein
MNQSSGVVCMEMSQYDLTHISGGNPEGPELGTNLFLGVDGEADRAAVKRMPGGMVSILMDTRGLACVDQNDSFFMLNDPGVNRQPL